jgi:metallo-beta-lactamase family protein
MPKLTFLGATGCVTGSKFLVEAGGERLLIDGGLFQGKKELRLRNWDPLPIAPSSIHHILLTHAHIDHTGYLPRLVRDGFAGRIYANAATADLCKILLPDSARLQEEDAEHAAFKKFSKHDRPEPLYTEEQANLTLTRFTVLDAGQTSRSVLRSTARLDNASANPHAPSPARRDDARKMDRPGGLSYSEPADGFHPIGRRFRARLHPAGHILGSSSIELHIEENGRTTTILFSGDVGRYDQPILRDPARPPRCDYLVCESTYGNREHPADNPHDALAEALTRVAKRGGQAVIPAFAVGRTQTLLYVLRQLEDYQRIPKMPVYVDSPMAITATELYLRHRYDHDLDFQREDAAGGRGDDPLNSRHAHMSRSRDESRQINNVNFPAVIISASGMATGGRILYHLARRLPDSRNAILLAGFQAEGTRGRALLEGARHLRIHGEDIPVKAEIIHLSQFSAHAGQSELLRWLRALTSLYPEPADMAVKGGPAPAPSPVSNLKSPIPSGPKQTFLVHGEPDACGALRDAISAQLQWPVAVPEYRSSVDL